MNCNISKSKAFENGYKVFCEYLERIDFQPDRQKKIYIFYSGGKDASLLIDFYLEYRVRNNINFEIIILTTRFPEVIYNSHDIAQKALVQRAIEYWTNRGVVHQWTEVENVNDKMLIQSSNPCGICETAKIQSMNVELSKPQYKDSLICLGHTLDDIVGYFSEIFYIAGGYLDCKKIKIENSALFLRILKLSRWVYLTYKPYETKNNYIYIKPLMFLDEKLIRKIVESEQYPLIPECCSDVMGDKFQLYKRLVAKEIEWLDKQYENDKEIYENILYRNYDTIFARFSKLSILPTQNYIENIKI